MTTITVRGKEHFVLPEGKTLKITGSADAVGMAFIFPSSAEGSAASQSYSLSASPMSIGPFIGDKRFEITCDLGSITFTQVIDFAQAAGVPNFADNETPSGAVPGSIFNLANAPSPVGSLILQRNGNIQTKDVDYTLVGTTITYSVAMASGDTHAAWYRY